LTTKLFKLIKKYATFAITLQIRVELNLNYTSCQALF